MCHEARPIKCLTLLSTNTEGGNDLNEKWGSYTCQKFKEGKKCDLCSHMREKDHIQSFHFQNFLKIHGHLAHDKIPEGYLRWFIYSIEDIPCHKRIVGSTTKPTDRWRNHKSNCNSRKSNSTGLSSHFRLGCPNDMGKEKQTLDFTLIDFYDTTEQKLIDAGHVSGPKCRCVECQKLKLKEDQWILNLGTLYKDGLNLRDEVKGKSRFNWK